uniref:Uncharacterized protein n=1 Tax=Anguilla anguilla TaxID=7936 RepID=A0A0E9WFX8_ANGAN
METISFCSSLSWSPCTACYATFK